MRLWWFSYAGASENLSALVVTVMLRENCSGASETLQPRNKQTGKIFHKLVTKHYEDRHHKLKAPFLSVLSLKEQNTTPVVKTHHSWYLKPWCQSTFCSEAPKQLQWTWDPNIRERKGEFSEIIQVHCAIISQLRYFSFSDSPLSPVTLWHVITFPHRKDQLSATELYLWSVMFLRTRCNKPCLQQVDMTSRTWTI